MSVIIRLQNLPWSANALDIREFFKGLSIPEGGVHIVGGELGDAFIAFSTDEDARLAMRMSGTSLKGIQVTLLLSSRTEMQKVIESARQQAMALHGYQIPPVIPSQPQPQPGASPVSQQQPQAQPQMQPQPQPQPQQQPQQQQQLPQPPQPPQIHPPSQGGPTASQPLVPPPHMQPQPQQQQQQQQHPSHVPYPMHGYMPGGPDGSQPLPPMPPHMPHVPPVTMQQMSQMGQQDGPYNNMPNQLENNDAQVQIIKEEKKDEKRTSTTSSSAGKRDSKGRDSRRRRTRSRSRSRSRSRDRDRDRYRRHRSRSRSRSRDRSSRSHRRSRSRDRDRRDKTRDRDRGRDRDRDRERDRGSKIGRDRADRTSQDSNKVPMPDQLGKEAEATGGMGGIPGLGDIPSVDMRGPLPSSLAEPIRNSPIQTPPGPAPSVVPPYHPTPSFNNESPFPQQMPFNNFPPNIPQGNVPAPNTVDTPTDMELIAEDDGSLDQDGPSEGATNDSTPEQGISKSPGEFMGGKVEPPMMRGGPGEFGPRFGGMPSLPPPPGPQFVNRAPVPMRPNNGFPFGEQQGNFPPKMEGGNFPPQMEGGGGFKPENFDPRNRPDQPPQMNWPPGGEGSNQGDPQRFQVEREQRGLRGEQEGMNRGPMGERDPRENNEMNEEHGNWDPRNRMGHMEEPGPGWDGPNRSEGMKPNMWNGRGRQGNFHPRNERGYDGRNDQEGWHEQDNWGSNDGFGEGEFEENFNNRGYRGRGGRGWDRGRGIERGRGSRGGFNSRHGEFGEGHHEEGFGSHGRGSFRGRGQRWGGHQFNEETACVELHNVPLSASYRAIREFFQFIYVPSNSVKIIMDDQGNRTDVVYVRLSHPRDAVKALKFSGNYIFDNSIEISLVSEAKYEAEVDIRQRGPGRGFRGGPPMEMERAPVINSPCLYVTGLPMGCADHDVAPIFEKFKIEDIVIERVRGTRTPSGGCFVRLSTCEEAQKACMELAHAAIDGSRLCIEMCPPNAMGPAVRDRDIILGKAPAEKEKNQDMKKPLLNTVPSVPNQAETQPAKQPLGGDLLTDSVIIKRVPKEATEANIRDFFSDEGLVPERMHFCEAGTNGVREVYVMFPLTEDAKRALRKNEQQIGKMKVIVELIAKPLVMKAMDLPFDPMELIKKGQKSAMDINAKEEVVQGQGKVVPLEGAEFIPDEEHDEMLKGGEPMGESMMNMPFGNAYDDHPQFRGRIPGPQAGGRGYMPRSGEMRGMPRMMGSQGRGGMAEFGGRMRAPLLRPPTNVSEENIGTAIPPENFGKPGCVVALGNLPYRCTTDDILDFLHEIPELRPEHVIRRYNEFNQPTADARVALASPQDAQRVVQSHNKRMMDNRLIFVSLV